MKTHYPKWQRAIAIVAASALSSLPVFSEPVMATGTTGQPAVKAVAPNVLFIAVDDLNDWVGFLKGHPDALTPNMDRLAERGTVFRNAQCTAPLCGPSRASLMTGLRPSTTGIYLHPDDNKIRDSCDATRAKPFLHEYFGQRGYETLAVGKIFHHHVPTGTVDQSGGRGGWGPMPKKKMNWDSKGTLTDWGAYPDADDQMPDYEAATWAVNQLKQPRDKPIFLMVGFIRPHVPWLVPQQWFDLHPRTKATPPPYLTSDFDDIPEMAQRISDMPMMPTTEWAIANDKWRDIVQAYLACVTFADNQIGRVLDALDASPAGKNTIVVLWGDHGYHLGEKNRFAKHALWERATRVPLIIVTPGGKGGQVCHQPVSLLDLYPTLLDLAGLPPNPPNEGHSLKPLLENPEREWPYPAVTTWGRNNHAVRDARYHYMHFNDGSEELYDLVKDPNEWRNLAQDPEHAAVIVRLQQSLPKINAPWAPNTAGGSPGLNEQRKREETDPLLARLPDNFTFAADQYERMLARLQNESRFPRSYENGHLRLVNPEDWTSGFFPGSLWYLYEYTGDSKWLEAASNYTSRLERIKNFRGHHDVGFMLNCSYGNGLRMTGNPAYRQVLLQGANSLATRYKSEVGLIRSWDFGKWKYPVIVDNMMNLELLMWASKHGGPERLETIALSHADLTLKNHFRSDHSSYHLVDYDPTNGSVLKKQTVQGAADDSAWARGQAWGLYGFTVMARETGRGDYLAQATNVANFILHHPRLPADKIPYWDFDAPGIPDAPRDASAAAVMSSALIELSGLVGGQVGREYLNLAQQQLLSLSSPAYRARPGEDGDFILRHSVGHIPEKHEIDVPLNYADYYYLEALLHYQTMVKRRQQEEL